MKKLLLLVAVLYSVTGWGQAGNLIHSYMPTWSTSARPTLTNGDIGINTDSSKLQFNIGGTTFTVGGSSGGGTTYTASQSVTLTGTNFTLTNDNASPGNSMLYGTNSSGTLGWYAQPGALSGLSTGYMPVATGSAALGNSNVFTTGKEVTITFGTSNTYADYIGYGAGNANNRFNAAINIFGDSIGFSNFGGVASQANSAVMQVNGVADILGNLWVASNSSSSGMEITSNQIIAKLSTNNIYFNTGAGPSYPAIFFPSGNSAYGANASDNGISVIQSTSTTLPQLGGYYNSSNYFKMQANSSGNLTITASGGLVTIPNQVQVGPNGGTLTWNPSTQVPFVTGGGTLNDASTSASGTVTNVYDNNLTGSTLTATNTAVTYTNAYTVLINQAPTAGTHVSITNPYALGVIGPAIFQTQLSTASLAIYNWQTVTTGTASTVNNNQTNWLLNPASLIAAYTVTMPAAPSDGQFIQLFFGGTISGGSAVVTSLTVSANSGQTLMQSAAPTTAVGGSCYIYQYNAALAIWYRKQ